VAVAPLIFTLKPGLSRFFRLLVHFNPIMKKIMIIGVLLTAIGGYNFLSCNSKTPGPEKIIAQRLIQQGDTFAVLCRNLLAMAKGKRTDEKQLQDLFLRTRVAYKNFEWAAEYFEPATSRLVNGPPVEEVENSGQVLEPAGLQVIEGYLFPKYDTSKQKELILQLQLLQSACPKYQAHFANIEIFNWQVFDAIKLEVFRIITLGISGFDNPLTLNSSMECLTSLRSMQSVITCYSKNEDSLQLFGKFKDAINYLRKNDDFNSFDRAEFIIKYANPITTQLSDFEQKLMIPVTRYNRLLNQNAKTLFDTNAFNVNAYAPDPNSFVTDEKKTLGKALFSDPSLSSTGTRSCQSCHQPEKAFTDGLVKNTVIGNLTLLKRNTPTLLNSAFQPALFYDLRVDRLEEQALAVVQNVKEMHGSLTASVKLLWQNDAYRQMFSKAFPKKDRIGIDTLEVMNAIASYIRSLVYLNSRFDQYMRGNKEAMAINEIRGFNLFMGKAKCGTCHYMPLFNGTFPPRYMKSESEVIGVPQSAAENAIDTDMGRYNVVRVQSNKHAFKISTIRNASLTAPYMHNGVFRSLKEVIDFYDKGGGEGLGLRINNQTLPPGRLLLTETEKNDIIAFIKCLESNF
jgi:cytochrome c peroxidase